MQRPSHGIIKTRESSRQAEAADTGRAPAPTLALDRVRGATEDEGDDDTLARPATAAVVAVEAAATHHGRLAVAQEAADIVVAAAEAVDVIGDIIDIIEAEAVAVARVLVAIDAIAAVRHAPDPILARGLVLVRLAPSLDRGRGRGLGDMTGDIPLLSITRTPATMI